MSARLACALGFLESRTTVGVALIAVKIRQNGLARAGAPNTLRPPTRNPVVFQSLRGGGGGHFFGRFGAPSARPRAENSVDSRRGRWFESVSSRSTNHAARRSRSTLIQRCPPAEARRPIVDDIRRSTRFADGLAKTWRRSFEPVHTNQLRARAKVFALRPRQQFPARRIVEQHPRRLAREEVQGTASVRRNFAKRFIARSSSLARYDLADLPMKAEGIEKATGHAHVSSIAVRWTTRQGRDKPAAHLGEGAIRGD